MDGLCVLSVRLCEYPALGSEIEINNSVKEVPHPSYYSIPKILIILDFSISFFRSRFLPRPNILELLGSVERVSLSLSIMGRITSKIKDFWDI